MDKFAVTIKETLSRTVIVESDSFDDATQIVNDKYDNGDIVLESDDMSEIEFVPSVTFGTEPIASDNPSLEYFEKLNID